jgi:hypothetical protein
MLKMRNQSKVDDETFTLDTHPLPVTTYYTTVLTLELYRIYGMQDAGFTSFC